MATYKLTIGNVEYELNKATASTNLGSVTLTKLLFNKGLYRPGEIHATFTISLTTAKVSDIKTELVENTGGRLKVKLSDSSSVTYAENYYVFKFKPIFKTVSSATSITVELDIFSEDKLLTFDKYSKAYTARKLGADIFKNYMPVVVTSNADSVSDKLIVISYTDTKTNKANEFIQPYLVQYNESFYDFLKRTANRCGEFLYHENGKLQLGMEVTDKTANDYTSKASEYYFEDIYEGSLKVGDFGYNYMKESDQPDRPYDDPLSADEYLDKIGKNYTDYATEFIYFKKDFASYICDAVCEASTISEFLANFTFSVGCQVVSAGFSMKALNDLGKETNIDAWEDKDEMWNDNELRQFGTGIDQTTSIQKTTNLYATFYAKIRELQKGVGQSALVLKFEDDLQDLMIGDHILCNSNHYLVIDVKGSFEYDEGTKKNVIKQRVVAIPFYVADSQYIPIPPMLANTTIRESESQHGVVVEYLDPNKIGRLRVRFAWQKEDDDVSPWIRVTLPFATDGGGIKFRPEKGDEVMISFVDGNVERPYVSGFLLSPKSNESWSWLPNRSITSKNGHNITFEDDLSAAGFIANLFPVLGAVKSFVPTELIPEKARITGTEQGRSLSGGTTISDRYGFYKIEMSTDQRSIEIKSSLGSVTLNAFTGINIMAPNGNIKISGKNVDIEASNKVNITSGTGVKKRLISDSGAGKDASIKEKILRSAGWTAFDTIYGTLYNLGMNISEKFLDMSFLRTVIELFTRPIDGTTAIKSNTFIQLEAGKGQVDYPSEAYSKIKYSDDNFVKLVESFATISKIVEFRVHNIKIHYQALCKAIASFKAISGDSEGMPNKDGAVINYDDIVTEGWENKSRTLDDDKFHWDANDLDIPNNIDVETVKSEINTDLGLSKEPEETDDCFQDGAADKKDFIQTKIAYDEQLVKRIISPQADINKKKAKITSKRQQVRDAAISLVNNYVDMKNCFNDFEKNKMTVSSYKSETAASLNAILTELEDSVAPLSDIYNEKLKITTVEENYDWDKIKKKFRRKAVYHLLDSIKSKSNLRTSRFFKLNVKYDSTIDVTDEAVWNALVKSWVTESSAIEITNPIKENDNMLVQMGSKMVDDYIDWAKESFIDPILDNTWNHRRWATGVNGQILMSNEAGKTIRFDPNGVSAVHINAEVSSKVSEKLIDTLTKY